MFISIYEILVSPSCNNFIVLSQFDKKEIQWLIQEHNQPYARGKSLSIIILVESNLR